MWPDRVSNPEPLALESDALLTAPRGPAGQDNVLRLITGVFRYFVSEICPFDCFIANLYILILCMPLLDNQLENIVETFKQCVYALS